MKIKLISKGRKNGVDTAEVIVLYPAKAKGKFLSDTFHLVKTGGKYVDMFGSVYDIK